MKKLLLFLLLLILLALGAIYIFIPSTITISGTRTVAVTSNGFDSCLHNPQRWKYWWPQQPSATITDSLFVYSDYSYKLSTPFSDGGLVAIKAGDLSYEMRIRTVPWNRDSVVAEWKTVLPTASNPFTRISRYFNAGKLKDNIQTVFDSLCSFANKTENIYGFTVKRTTFTEVILVATRFTSSTYPSMELVYQAINKLRQYISTNGATEKYYPMMNSKQVDSAQYETMVAISIDKMIPAGEKIFISRMVPMQDRFLETNTNGGPFSVEKAHLAIEKYMTDHSLSSPARPFDILVTDRSKEPDTAKWVTKIFYPSM